MKEINPLTNATRVARVIRIISSVLFWVLLAIDGISLIFYLISAATGFASELAFYILAFVLPYFYVSVTFIVVAAIMKKLLKSIENHEPFAANNAKRLRFIGITMVIGSFFKPIFLGLHMLDHLWMHNVLADNVIGKIQVYNNLVFDISLLFGGLLVMVISYVFSYGARLQREHDQTV